MTLLDVRPPERVKELVSQANTSNPAQGIIDVLKKAGGFFGE